MVENHGAVVPVDGVWIVRDIAVVDSKRGSVFGFSPPVQVVHSFFDAVQQILGHDSSLVEELLLSRCGLGEKAVFWGELVRDEAHEKEYLSCLELETFARIGRWRWELGAERLFLTAGAIALFPRGAAHGGDVSVEELLSWVFADDRVLTRAALRRVANTGIVLPLEFRVACETGVCYVRMESLSSEMVMGQGSTLEGFFRDVTELRELKQSLNHRDKELDEARVTMHELIQKISDAKNTVRAEVLQNIEVTVRPILRQMQAPQHLRELSLECREALERISKGIDGMCDEFLTEMRRLDVRLTHAESRICHLSKAGYAVKEIAEMLILSPQTVKSHVRSIRRKLGIVDSRQPLGSYLRQSGL